MQTDISDIAIPPLSARRLSCTTLIWKVCTACCHCFSLFGRGSGVSSFFATEGCLTSLSPQSSLSRPSAAQAPCRKEARLELALHSSFSWIHGHCCVQYQMAIRASHHNPSAAVSLAVCALRKVRQPPTPKHLSRTHRVWCADMPDRSDSCRTGCK